MFKRFRKSEKGQGMVEYGLILALVSIVALGALGGIGGKLNDTFDKVVGVVSGGETVVPADFIPVATAEELAYLNESKEQTFGKGTKWEGEYTSGLDKNYILVSNLDLSGIEFEPLGTLNNGFEGIFDGGGYVISNLTVDKGSYNRAGLFGYAEGASFKNIGLEEVNVKGASFSGGLVGRQYESSITDSYATGNVTGDSYVGGLVGYQDNSSITDSYATGDITVTGTNYVGGLVGRQYNSSTTDSYATGTVTGTDFVGGLVGYQLSSSTINSYATGNVTSGYRVGGLVGWQQTSSTVTNSYSTGNVTGKGASNYVGGLVGGQTNSSTITDSYATGNVTGDIYVGGLVGWQDISSVTNSYAKGNVTGADNVGGLVGYQKNSSTTSSYYDKDTTKQSDTGKGEGKTTVEMKNKDTYTGWDFESIWTIESGQYPTHR